MKYARNAFLALVVLALFYGGCYWLFYRDQMFSDFYILSGAPFMDWGEGDAWRRFYAPAAEIDLRLTYDRPAKKRLAGHWLSEKPGDFIILAKDGSCRFQLGEFSSSGNLPFHRGVPCYAGTFQHQGIRHNFNITVDEFEWASVLITSFDTRVPIEFPLYRRAPDAD